MKRLIQWVGACALMGVMMCALVLSALAQSSGGGKSGGGGGGGNGGGGVARHGGNYNILWDTAQAINGRTPKAVGSVNLSTYVTTLNVDVKLSSVNLPDNTDLTVTVYVKDYYTGEVLPSKVAGTFTLIAQKGALVSNSLWVTDPGLLPVVTNIVITQADGTIVMSGHP